MANDYIMHYGAKGQKWGVRNWQNYDGTFNEAGKERYFGNDGTRDRLRSESNVRKSSIDFEESSTRLANFFGSMSAITSNKDGLGRVAINKIDDLYEDVSNRLGSQLDSYVHSLTEDMDDLGMSKAMDDASRYINQGIASASATLHDILNPGLPGKERYFDDDGDYDALRSESNVRKSAIDLEESGTRLANFLGSMDTIASNKDGLGRVTIDKIDDLYEDVASRLGSELDRYSNSLTENMSDAEMSKAMDDASRYINQGIANASAVLYDILNNEDQW